MKKILAISFLLLAGLVAKVQASGFVTFGSTGVFLSSGTGVEITSIMVSTGSSTPGSVWVVCVDTVIALTTPSATTNAANVLFPLFRKDSWLFPPVVFQSSAAATSYIPMQQLINLQDVDGGGREADYGIFCAIQGAGANANNADSGYTVTLGYRRKPSGRAYR